MWTVCVQSHTHTHTKRHTHIPVQFSQGPYCSVCSLPPSASSEPLSPRRWIHFFQVCPCHTHTACTCIQMQTRREKREAGESEKSYMWTLLLYCAHYWEAGIDGAKYIQSASEQSISSCVCNTRRVLAVSHEQPCEFRMMISCVTAELKEGFQRNSVNIGLGCNSIRH